MRWPYPFKVLVTTSGTGSRLRELTENKNKALIKVNGKSILSYIIDSYPKEVRFVVTLGFLGDQVKEYISNYHPQLRVEYVWVDKYVGPGTSCGYSMLKAEPNLQCPFIFHACDTIVTQPIPRPDANWTGGNPMSHLDKSVITQHFRTHWLENDKLLRINDVGVSDYHRVHIGLTGVKDYGVFWDSLNHLYSKEPNNQALTDTHVINEMIKKDYSFTSTLFDPWLDTGNPDTLANSTAYLSNLKAKDQKYKGHQIDLQKIVA